MDDGERIQDILFHRLSKEVKGMLDNWDALKNWKLDYLAEKMGQNTVSVDITPTGHGDCVVYDSYFVEPYQKKMKFGDFIDIMAKKKPGVGVYYIQKQNNNFSTEFDSFLGKDVPKNVEEFGTKVFDCVPDAVNFWMGDDRAVSSLHKDHYENLYAVVKGQKIFTLLPPTDLPYLYKKEYRSGWFRLESEIEQESPILVPVSGDYYNGNDDWKIMLDESGNKVSWIPLDPDSMETVTKFPKFLKASPVVAYVKAGEVLYLPSLVYHRVAQEALTDECTIAVNYWFDMKFDLKYCYHKFLEGVVNIEQVAVDFAKEKKKEIDHEVEDALTGLDGLEAEGQNFGKPGEDEPEDLKFSDEDEIDQAQQAIDSLIRQPGCQQQ